MHRRKTNGTPASRGARRWLVAFGAVALASACGVEHDGDAESRETTTAAVSNQNTMTPEDYLSVADVLAFDEDFVALQMKSIELFGDMLEAGTSMTPQTYQLLSSGEATTEQIVSATGITVRDAEELRVRAMAVVERFPWLPDFDVEIYALAMARNANLYVAFESQLRQNPETAAMVMPADPTASAARANTMQQNVLAAMLDDIETALDNTFGSYTFLAVLSAALIVAALPVSLVSVTAAVVLANLSLVTGVLYLILSDIIEDAWNGLKNLVGEIFGGLFGGGNNNNDDEDENECYNDQQCDPDEWCDKGPLGIGTNRCRPDRNLNALCTRGAQCQTGCCRFNWGLLKCRPCP